MAGRVATLSSLLRRVFIRLFVADLFFKDVTALSFVARQPLASRGMEQARRAIGPQTVPGLAPSDKYSVQMHDGLAFADLFTFSSISKPAHSKLIEPPHFLETHSNVYKKDDQDGQDGQRSVEPEACNGYFSHLENWTASWVNLEMRKVSNSYADVTLEVSKLYGNQVISRATILPASARDRASVIVRDGKAFVTLTRPCQLYLDVDGQMEEVDTGPSYEGPPVHSFNIFANPELAGSKPEPSSPGVRMVEVGEPVPKEFAEPVLYFAPGVHELDANSPYLLQSGKAYYIPIDAWIKGPLSSGEKIRDVRVFGYGTLVGSDIERGRCQPNESPEGLRAHEALNMSIEGLTFVDFPNHHLVLGGGDEPELPNVLSHVKVLGWRANGDGVHVCSNWRVEDLFLRTQDDSLYIGSCAKRTSFARVITWNDANGASFIFTSARGGGDASLTDSDAIYSRSSWAFWAGGRVFNLRSIQDDQTIANISIDGIRASDPLPTMPFIDLNAHTPMGSLLQLQELEDWKGQGDGRGKAMGLFSATEALISNMTLSERQIQNLREHMLYNSDESMYRLSGKITNVTFSNVIVRNTSTMRYNALGQSLGHGLVNVINATSDSESTISNLAFNNVTIAGKPMEDVISDITYFYLDTSGIANLSINGHGVIGSSYLNSGYPKVW